MIEFFITTGVTGRLDVTERVASYRLESMVPGGWWEARVELDAPRRDLWRLQEGWEGGTLEAWAAGEAVWRGELARVRLKGARMRVEAVGAVQKLADEELWRVIADPEYRRWLPEEEPTVGFVCDNNNRVYVAGSGEFSSGDEVTVSYPDDETELGAGIVRIQGTAAASLGYGAWKAELRTAAGTVLWSATATTSGEIDLSVSDAEGLALALQATDNFATQPAAPTIERADDGAGNLSDGSYGYRVTFVDANGESEASNISRVTIYDHTADGKVELTNIPTGHSGTTDRKIYRTEADGDDFYLLATLADNTTTNYTDNIADGCLGAAMDTEVIESYAKITSLVVRTLYPAMTSDVVDEVLDGSGLDTSITATSQEVDRAIYQRRRKTSLTALREMAELGDGSESWVFAVYDGEAVFRAWDDDPDWLITPELLDRIELEWARDAVFNAVRAELPDGWRSDWYTDDDSIAKFGRRERTVDMPDTTRAEARTLAQIFLADNAWPAPGLRLEAGARVRKPDSSLWPGYLVRAGDVIALRDVVPYEDITVQAVEVEVSPQQTKITPRGAVDRLEVLIAEIEQRRQSTEEHISTVAQGQEASAERQQTAIEALTFASSVSGDGGGGGGEDGMTEAEHTAIGDGAPHHARYEDVEAVSAMGVKADSNPLNHDRYTDGEASAAAPVQSVDGKTGTVDLSGDYEADGTVATHAADSDAHHSRYDDAEAVAAIKAADGPGSGLDADTLDGFEGSDLVPITRIISAVPPLAVSPADGVLDDDLTLSINKIGVPLRMDTHGITMGLGFEMDNGRLLGYNE